MYTPEDSKGEQERDFTDTTNLRHPGVPPIIRPESRDPSVSAPVTGGDPRLRDVPAGRTQTVVTLRDDLHMLQRRQRREKSNAFDIINNGDFSGI